MPKEDYSELVQYLDTKFEGVDKKFKRLEEKIDDNGDKIDKALGLYKNEKQERTMLGNRVARSEKNIVRLAEATDTEIEQ